MAEQVVSGRMDIERSDTHTRRRVDAILEKRRWMLARGQIAMRLSGCRVGRSSRPRCS